jgi:hypothetical protein
VHRLQFEFATARMEDECLIRFTYLRC